MLVISISVRMTVSKKLFCLQTVSYREILKHRPCSFRHFTRQECNLKLKCSTRNVFQQKIQYQALVKRVEDVTPSIKMVQLHVKEPGFTFKAGQWVDLCVPERREIGSYSITSPPYEAEKNGTLQLVVKYGTFPPTLWMHTACKEGDAVEIKVSGDFFYDPSESDSASTADLLLIGGGMGINPMVSILSQYCYFCHGNSADCDTSLKLRSAILLYSTKTEEEMIFKDRLEAMRETHPTVTCQYFLTQSHGIDTSLVKNRRIEERDIVESVSKLRRNNLCYVCGPARMTDDMTTILRKLGIKNNYIKYEDV